MEDSVSDVELKAVIAQMSLQLAKLTAEVAQIRSVVTSQPSHIEGWADAHKAAAALQADGVKNAAELKRMRLAGVFSEVRGEIRVKPNVKRQDTKSPRYQYHIPKCRKALQRHFR